MQLEDCYLVGHIRRAHGIKGEIKAFFDVDYLEEYTDMESVYFLQGNKLVPFFIDRFRPTGPNLAILALRDVRDKNAADELAGLEMYLPLDQLPDLEPGQFYYHDIIGFTVEDTELGTLGTVKEVREMPAQDLLVMKYQGAQVLIPLMPQIVLDADYPSKTVRTTLPEGLLEIYT